MPFIKTRKVQRNYDIFSTYNYFTPGPGSIGMIALWLLVGALLGNVATLIVYALIGESADAQQYATLISYPIMFIPPMMYAGYKSRMNAFFDEGFQLDNNHFKPVGGLFLGILLMIATICASFVSDIFTPIMPEMPEWLRNILEGMTEGKLWVDLICVSIFAPFFEEWLCRGIVLRGLLNYKHKDKEGNEKIGIKASSAILLSAAFFAIIHMNPWQALPAFILGSLFGYVYYRTGSLKLTMLMHCTNNTFAVLMSHIDKFEDMESWLDVFPVGLYIAVLLFCLAFIAYTVSKLRSIETSSSQGNCDKISA